MDTFTSLLAGCTIFAVLGYLKETTGAESIEDVTPGGKDRNFKLLNSIHFCQKQEF